MRYSPAKWRLPAAHCQSDEGRMPIRTITLARERTQPPGRANFGIRPDILYNRTKHRRAGPSRDKEIPETVVGQMARFYNTLDRSSEPICRVKGLGQPLQPVVPADHEPIFHP